MNNKKQMDIKSINSVGSIKDRGYDTIPSRINFIKELLDGKKLDPMIDFDNTQTEQFTNPNGFQNADSDDDSGSKDTRIILNKQLHNFYEIINQIGGKLKYIKSGTTGHTFKGIVKTENGSKVYYGVKVVAYPKREKYGDMNDIRRPENAELMMIRLLSYFVLKKQTPHIALPIGTFNTSIKPFANLIENKVIDQENTKYNDFIKKYNDGYFYDKASILISEWANRGDFLDFTRKNYKEFLLIHWKVFFFQIISVLAVIQSKFPSFRHNDLKANNILIHKVKQRGTLFSYTVNRSKYIVPSIGYQVKLWDFDFACMPGTIENSKVSALWTDKINVKPVQNRYYDMHYFFNTFIKKGFFPQYMQEKCIPIEAKEFVDRIVPKKFKEGKYTSEKGRILVDTEYILPDDVLKTDIFFEEFRNHKIKKKE
jgi:serine/threonine protein kinase